MRKRREKIIQGQRMNIARVLFYLNTALWFVISFFFLGEMLLDDNGLSMALVGFFFLVNLLALFFGGRLLDQNEKWTWIFALVVVILNIALTFTGLPDLMYVGALIIDVIILVLLLSLRENYFQ